MKKIMTVLLTVSLLITSFVFVISSSATDAAGSYVVFGDSIASGYGVTEENGADTKADSYVAGKDSNAYCGIVARTLNFDLYNNAKSGATTEDLLKILENESVLAQLKNASLVTVSIGGNDIIDAGEAIYESLLSGTTPTSIYSMFTPEVLAKIEIAYNQLEENLTAVMTKIVQNCPDGVILLQTLYNPYKSNSECKITIGKTTYKVGTLLDTYINRVNKIYANVQEEVGGFYLCDTAAAMNSDSACFYSGTMPDFHPTNHGHEVIAATILADYAAHKPEETTESTSAATEITSPESEETTITTSADETTAITTEVTGTTAAATTATTAEETTKATTAVTTRETTARATTAEPTTAEPTTAEPTTAEPTTAEPTTAEPTTAEPTTAEPTTAEPTTAEPTTAEPTTAEPTTAETTTAEPTTAVTTTAETTFSDESTSATAAETTTVTEKTTSEATTTAKAAEKKGCGSTISGTGFIVLIVTAFLSTLIVTGVKKYDR